MTSAIQIVEKLIFVGKVAAALTPLIKLVEMLVPLYPKIAHIIHQSPEHKRADMEHLLRWLTIIESREEYSGLEEYTVKVFVEMQPDFGL